MQKHFFQNAGDELPFIVLPSTVINKNYILQPGSDILYIKLSYYALLLS